MAEIGPGDGANDTLKELKQRLETLEQGHADAEELKTRLEALERRLETAEGGVRQLVKHVRREKARSKWPERDRSGLLSPQNDDDAARVTMPAIQRDPPKGPGRARRVA